MTNTTKDAELLGCPFCGSSAVFEGEEKNGAPHLPQMRCVSCSECEAYGPEKWTDAEAIAAWNTRPSPSQEQRDGVVVELTLFAEEYELAATRAKKDVLANQSAERLLALLQPQGQDHD